MGFFYVYEFIQNGQYEPFGIKNTSKFFHLTNSLTFAFPKKQADNYVCFSSLYMGIMVSRIMPE
jgi:hypothetical protein